MAFGAKGWSQTVIAKMNLHSDSSFLNFLFSCKDS